MQKSGKEMSETVVCGCVEFLRALRAVVGTAAIVVVVVVAKDFFFAQSQQG